MDHRSPPLAVERVMEEDDLIVSKTDMAGRITYVNRRFIELSGYSEHELLGAEHSIVRHPDMPCGMFKFLWQTVKDKSECFIYLKNRTRNGGFYWALANFTPNFDREGNVVGYFSISRQPSRESLKTIESLYQAMLEVEHQKGGRDDCDASLAYLDQYLAEKGMSYAEFILSI